MDITVQMVPAPPRGIEQSVPVPTGAETAEPGGKAASVAGVDATARGAGQTASPFVETGPARRETRLALDIDEATQRVVGRFIDTETGEVVRQIPPEEVLRLLARARELIGAILDETA